MFSEGARVDDPMIQKEITEAELPDVSDFPAEVADSLPQYEKPEDAPKDSEPKWKLPDGELSEDRVRFNAIWDEIYHHPQQFDLDQGLPQIPPEMQDMVARAMIKAGRGTDVRLRLSRFGFDASFELLSEEVFLELAKKGVDDLSLDPFWNLSKKSISKIIEGGRGELILAHPDHFVSIPTDIARESLAKKGKNLYSIPSELLARANLDSGEVAEILLSNGGEEVVIQSFRIFKEEQKIPLAERLIKAGYGGKLLDSCYLLDDSLISNPDFSLLFIENGLAGQVSEMIRERKFPGTAEVIDKLTSLGYLDFFDGESFYGIKSISVGALKKILLERTDLKVSYLGDTKIVGAT
jgi:hypothetical protein